jgi:tetratricopeptide (TPR) repeat protein
MNIKMKLLCGLMMAVVASGAGVAANAADVRVGLSTRETYVGLPVTLRIQVANATKAEPPVVPNIDGVNVKALGAPSHSTQITSINGRTTTSTTQTFAYELTPQRAGTFQIPPVTINADGEAHHTRAIEFVASKSETGDLMFVEIAGKQKQIYVGQALDLTLKIWLRPYSDRRLKVKLSEGDMWRLISDRSAWGPFAEQIQKLAQSEQRPEGKELLRKDADGVEHSYYLYQLEATIYPKRPGTIDGDNLKIVANYPTALGRSRGLFADVFEDMPGGGSSPFGDDDGFSPFGARLTIQTVRPLAEQAVVEPINVLPIPTAGRPADYRGAVGQYQIATDATPSHVKSGDPINLLVGISGTGPMELVQAPPLAELPKLTADFKVPSEPLAGFVKGERKIFQTTIRPRKPGITMIPAIPFSFFDPATAKFETAWSKPVSIKVEQAEMLALDSVVHSSASNGANPKSNQPAATTADSTSLAVFTGDDLLASQQPWSLDLRLLVTLLIAPPLAVLGICLARGRAVFGTMAGAFGSASGRLERAIARAESPAEIADVVKRFVARQCKLGGAGAEAEAVVGAVRVSGRRNLAIRCERLLGMCAGESRAVAIGDAFTFDQLKDEAMQWIKDWHAESSRQKPRPNANKFQRAKLAETSSSLRSSGAKVVAAIVMTGALLVGGQRASAQAVAPIDDKSSKENARAELSDLQQQTLLAEANKSYNTALEEVQSDSAEAKQGFADAADKYQLVVSGGVVNARLYFNLANAYLESGQTGRAVANYLRCLRIEPTMREAQINLAYARKALRAPGSPAASKGAELTFLSYVRVVNEWLNSRVSPRSVFVITAVAWVAVWTFIGARLLGYQLLWKTATRVAGLMFVLAATSSLLSWQSAERHVAVVVQVPAASSTNVDAASTKFSQGEVVEPIQKRGDSIRVRTENGDTVWLPTDSVEVI